MKNFVIVQEKVGMLIFLSKNFTCISTKTVILLEDNIVLANLLF